MRTSDRQVNSELALSIAKGILPWVPANKNRPVWGVFIGVSGLEFHVSS